MNDKILGSVVESVQQQIAKIQANPKNQTDGFFDSLQLIVGEFKHLREAEYESEIYNKEPLSFLISNTLEKVSCLKPIFDAFHSVAEWIYNLYENSDGVKNAVEQLFTLSECGKLAIEEIKSMMFAIDRLNRLNKPKVNI